MKGSTTKVAILGFGAEGKSILRYFKERNLYPKADIWILDQDAELKIPSKLHGYTLRKELGRNYLKNLSQFSVIFRSPGIPFNLHEIQEALYNGAKVTSATKIFFEECPTKIIGITGTKGKSTTAFLLAKFLSKSGFKTLLGGNIGTPMLELLLEAKSADFVVLELSSFQLQDLERSPSIAVVLDIFPDHLDAHRDFSEYLEAKAAIARHQKPSDTIFCFADNPLSKDIAATSPAKKVLVKPMKGGVEKNKEMAETVARFLRCPEDAIQSVLKNFKGLEHRLEFVRNIKIPSSLPKDQLTLLPPAERPTHFVSFYNDSQATNPHAAAFGVASLDPDCTLLILIAGGRDKKLDYKPLAEGLKKSKHVQTAILFGENKEIIKKELIGTVINLSLANDLNSAVKAAYEEVKRFIKEKDSEAIALHKLLKSVKATILLSPASTSFDMFKNYKERGEAFKKIVDRL